MIYATLKRAHDNFIQLWSKNYGQEEEIICAFFCQKKLFTFENAVQSILLNLKIIKPEKGYPLYQLEKLIFKKQNFKDTIGLLLGLCQFATFEKQVVKNTSCILSKQ